MAQQIFVTSSEFSAPVITLDIRDAQKQATRRATYIVLVRTGIFGSFYVTNCLHKSWPTVLIYTSKHKIYPFGRGLKTPA